MPAADAVTAAAATIPGAATTSSPTLVIAATAYGPKFNRLGKVIYIILATRRHGQVGLHDGFHYVL